MNGPSIMYVNFQKTKKTKNFENSKFRDSRNVKGSYVNMVTQEL